MNPGYAHRFQEAVALHRQGRLGDAEAIYSQIVATQPDHFDALHHLGIAKAQRGEHQAAEKYIVAALRLQPNSPEALVSFGNVLSAAKRAEEAIAVYDRALRLNRHDVGALLNRANTLCGLKRHEEALAGIEEALALVPRHPGALHNRGIILHELRRYDEALFSFDAALAIAPNFIQALNSRAKTLNEVRRFEEVLVSCTQAIALNPDYAEAHCNAGNALFRLGQSEEALAAYKRATAIDPQLAEAWLGRGNLAFDLKRHSDALSDYGRALALKPELAEGWLGRGNTFFDLRQYDEAAAAYLQSIRIDDGLAEAWFGRGNVLFELKRFEEALECYDKAVALDPSLSEARGARLLTRMHVCDWRAWHAETNEVVGLARRDVLVASPAALVLLPSSAIDQLKSARLFINRRHKVAASPLWNGERYSHDRIRLAYVSADLREHAVSALAAGCFESHDRTEFETYAFSLGPSDDSEMSRRLKKSFDHFFEVRTKTDREIAEWIRASEIDIAVDLMGLTEGYRIGIFAQRPAPIQVNYLGYPGTTGASYIDYIIADRFVIAGDDREFYSEKVVWLPHSYQANDRKRRISDITPSRAEANLPEHGFVFCCFNNTFKITPEIFEIWMRLLRAVDGSVLWLLKGNSNSVANLQFEAQKQGLSPDRLVFAQRLPIELHLARHRLADLFLDTLPYNAHTTGSDALWAGLPVLTCLGSTFAGRVGASLLHAVGLPELITRSRDEYERMAIRLANEPALLSSFRAKLAESRAYCPLFETESYTRDLERAYRHMRQSHLNGEKPRSFGLGDFSATES
jgi:predicted O-linked N-acetylglucosamine transferase (SPINDLY family)